MDTFNHSKYHTKSITFNNIVHDAKEKLKKMHIKPKSHKTHSTAKENAQFSQLNRHSNFSQVQSNHKTHNGSSIGATADKIKHPFEQNSCANSNGLANGHSDRDNRTIVQTYHEDRKLIR